MSLTTITPMLPVRHVPASLPFYEKLGFVVTIRNDQWGWARLALGQGEVMLDQSINTHPGAPRQSVLYLYPDDVRAFHANARANGLDVPELEQTFYGMLEFRIDDPDGNRLWIGQDVSPED